MTIGGITLAKWRPNFENAAPHQTITISSFAATIMSTNGKKAKKISAGRYCSPRAARKKTLSRRPSATSSTMIGTIAPEAMRPSPAAGVDEGDDKARKHPDVERHVDRRALVAARERAPCRATAAGGSCRPRA